MNDLIERIEAANSGSRALDWEIHVHDGIDGKGMYGIHPRYSLSIDAALTLVPEGWTWAFLDGDAIVRKAGSVVHAIATAATPALAICAAALKSRAYLKETNNAD